jgi:two-component system KDP operon response regulator KdpE
VAVDKLPILIVEDDVSLLQMMQSMLELEGYDIVTAPNGGTAIDLFDNFNPAMVLLDIGLPDMDGITVCKCIRRFSKVPIIMVTGNSEVKQKVEGLYAGADDYVTKPFSYSELIARINVVLRRSGFIESSVQRPNFKFQDLSIDFNKQIVMIGEERIDLTSTEYRILAYLAQNNGNIVVPGDLLKEIWGDEYIESLHLLQVNISRLRQKLNDNAHKFRYIETRPGQGYSLVVE